MSLTATFDATLSRVRLHATSLTPAGTALFERSINGVKWTTVRGGTAVAVDGSNEANLDDYEFLPGVVNYYRVTSGAHVYATTITPSQSGVWFKSISRPFLNMQVNVQSEEDITRQARNGVFPIIGRSVPVAVTDVRLSREWRSTLWVNTVADADALEIVFNSGDPLFIQVSPNSTVTGGYVVVNQMTRRRFGVLSTRRWFDLELTEVAAPGPDVVGSTVTWESLVAEFGTWDDVLAFFGTWADVLEYVSAPETVVVP